MTHAEQKSASSAQGGFDLRALFDVGLFLAFGFLIASQIPGLLAKRFKIESLALITLFTQGSFILAIWGLLAWRKYGFTHIGLRRLKDFKRSAVATIALVVFLLVLSVGTEAIGLRRDLSNFDRLKGNLPFTVFSMVFYGILSAGFYEEIVFRGYLMHRFADIFQRRRFGWALAIVFQASLFGFAHLHQGTYGAIYTGCIGLLFGAFYAVGIRNLWILILAHGVYDAFRMLYFYVLMTYGGLRTLAS